jgi:hypothetical protein
MECLAEPNEFTTLDEEVCRFSPVVLVEVGVLGTPPIEKVFCRGWRLIAATVPLHLQPRIAHDTSATAPIVCVALPRAVMVVVLVIVCVAYNYHVSWVGFSVTTSTAFLAHPSCSRLMLIFHVIAVVWRATTLFGVLNGVFSVGPLVCEAREVIDRLGLGSH